MSERIHYCGWIIQYSVTFRVHYAEHPEHAKNRSLYDSRLVGIKQKIDKHIDRWGW